MFLIIYFQLTTGSVNEPSHRPPCVQTDILLTIASFLTDLKTSLPARVRVLTSRPRPCKRPRRDPSVLSACL